MSPLPFHHLPVMLDEVVDSFEPVPAGVVLDATLGGGGHSRALLERYEALSIVGLDQDPDAIAAASEVLAPFGARATIVRSRFDRLDEVLADLGIGRLSGALFDLGVSSPQLDRGGRGFSYHQEAALNMRMDPDAAVSAYDVVNGWSETALARLFADHGEVRFSRRIARAVVGARPLNTTTELAEVVRSAIPAAARRTGGHPARRVFQALRVAVNEELEILPSSIDKAIERLAPGGRMVVLAYHSGEDRIVKERIRSGVTGDCTCPPGLPCACGAVATLRAVTRKPGRPRASEIEANPRAESARMRVAERLGDRQ